ncbi:PASTA domain-containing protein [Allorhizocola rhizosphaerae]|uniref:PASTA domain-containing protein n=1 Tax=Allorhizocola rhizosphaerae TaxID=1872709 RepID=UPI000E3C0B74|nr:PASTA domain-containing protein [Allorhizocola rhizosphaerae]
MATDTKWVVTTATERVTLDSSRSGEVTFTVTNQSNRNARAVFDIRTGEGVDESWFAIDDPQRPIRPAASVPYLVRINVPAGVAPGSYEIAARVCPPDTPPEESFVLSRRVMIEVPAPPAPPKKKFPWWIVVAAALLALVIGVVTWLVWPGGSPEPTPTPTPGPTTSAAPVEYAVVPKVVGLSPKDAVVALEKEGFTAGTVRYRWDRAANGTVAKQWMPWSIQAPKGTQIDLEVNAPATKPVISVPANGATIPANTMPQLTWTQTDSWVRRWTVFVLPESCTKVSGKDSCAANLSTAYVVEAKQHTLQLPKLDYTPVNNVWHNGWVQVQIQGMDDFGGLHEIGVVRFYLEH